MLNKKSKIFIIIFLLMTFFLFSQENDDSAPAIDSIDDPAASLQEEEIAASTSPSRYTDLEFFNLPDEEKWNVYFNFPQLLPENFDPEVYMHIFHPEYKETE